MSKFQTHPKAPRISKIGLLALLCMLCMADTLRSEEAEADTLIQLLNNPIGDVLATYEELTGKQVLREENLPNTMISINVTDPVPRSAAIDLIESALLLNGFVIVPGPGDSRKVLSIASGKNPRSQGLRVFSSEEQLPSGEVIISYIMNLSFLKAEEALPIFTSQFAPTQPYGNIVAVPSTNSLLITESASAIREMIGLQKLIDLPPPEVQAHFVTLSRANAERVLETIQQVIGGPSGEVSSGDTKPRAGSKLFATLGQTAPVEFAADTRTNRIIVVCPPEAFPYYSAFVRSFDSAAEFAPSYEFQLHYVAVGEILPSLAKALREGQPGQQGDRDGKNPDDPASLSQTGSNSTPTGASMTASSGESTNVLGTVQEQTDRNLPITLIVGNTRLIADQRNNTIIALAPPESIDRISAIVSHLDKPPMQVYLSIVIIEMDVTNSLEYGVDFLLRGSEGVIGSNQNIRGNTPTLGQLLNPGDLLNPANIIGTTSGLTAFGTFGTALDVLVSALESTGRVKVLGRPTVYTSNNKKAVISVGEEIPVPQSTVSTVNPNQGSSTALTSTIQYKDVLLQLEVVPLVNSNDEVTLEIAQRNDELGNAFEIAGSQVQSVRTQQIKTSVTVPNKNTVVLGGLITEREERTRSQIPVLGDLPLVGVAFSGTRTRQTRKELLLLIQPQIIQGERELFNVNALERRRMRSVDESTEIFIDPQLPPYDDLPPEAELVPFPAPPSPRVLPALPADTR